MTSRPAWNGWLRTARNLVYLLGAAAMAGVQIHHLYVVLMH